MISFAEEGLSNEFPRIKHAPPHENVRQTALPEVKKTASANGNATQQFFFVDETRSFR